MNVHITDLKDIANKFKSVYTKFINYFGIVAILLVAGLSFFLVKERTENKRNETNIEALRDTIHVQKTKNADLIFSIKTYRTDIKNLKHLNEKLYDKISIYKRQTKKTPTDAIDTSTETTLPQRDTVYIKTPSEPFRKTFDFSDKWRYLAGTVSGNDSTVSVHIDPEIIYTNLFAGFDNKNDIFVKADNPYVKITKLSGFKLPEPRKKHWGIGIGCGYGLDVKNGKFVPVVSINVQYNIFSF